MGGLEDRYTQIFNAVNIAIFTVDLEGNIKEINESLLSLTGYKREDLVGKNLSTLFASEYVSLVQLILKKTLDGKAIFKGETQIIKVDKSRIWSEISISVLKGHDESVTGQVCILRDITERKMKEQELKGSEKFLSNLVDNGIDAVYVEDNKGKITFFSKGGEKLLGWRAEDIIGQSFELLIAPEDLAALKTQLSSRRPDEHRAYQTVLLSKGGRRIDVIQKVIPIYKENNVAETCSIVTNITTQQKLQTELSALNDKLNSLIRLGKMISSRTNLEEILNFVVGSITIFAKIDIAVLRLLNEDKTELILRTCFGTDKSLIPKKINVKELLTKKALEEERVISVRDVGAEENLSAVESEVGEAVVSMLAVPLIARKESKGILYLYTREYCQFTRQQIDLAFAFVNQAAIAIESAMMYAREQDTINKLRDLDQAKSDFLSMVSHELRSPLTSIKGYTALILGGRVGEVNPKQRKFLEIVANQSNHLTKLISDLLDLSRIESGKIVLRKEKVQLKIITELIAERMKLQLDTKSINFKVDISDKLPFILGDGERMLQVFSNLISNALKFTSEGGSITIKIWQEDNNVKACFIDSGIGLSQEAITKIFSEFYQVDSSATRQVGGAGLGLAIVKKIIEAHEGKVWAESEGINKGTKVYLQIPALAEDNLTEGQTKSESKEEISSLSKVQRTILIVDDEQEVIDLLKSYLNKAGYNTIEALSGYKALEIAREKKPDLISLDFKLPDIDGSQVIELLKKDEATKDIPVIVLSVLQDSEKDMLRMGIADYLTKPIDGNKLISSIARILEKKEILETARILIVDDDITILTIVKNILEEHKYKVLEAVDGYQAIDLAEKENPDLILLDIVMPGMDGYEVIEKLKGNVQTQDIPVIILSSRKLEMDKEKGLRLGALKYLTKPFKTEELVKEIEEALGR